MGDRQGRAGAGGVDTATRQHRPTRRRRSTAEEVLRPTLGPIVCDWIEAYLCHGPGDIQGAPVILDDEFREFVWRAYEVFPQGHPREGRRVYRRGFLSRPKGRAKSELAGMLACAEALAEVRFDGWDVNGNPVGRPVVSPLINCFATEEEQAGNTFDNAYYMLANGAAYDDYPGVDIGLTRINLPDGGRILALTSAPSSKDGGKDTFDVFDETHLWTLPNLKKLHATVTRNLMKRMLSDGWSLETSTMYAPGEGSVAEETHKSSRSTPGVLFDHRQAPEVDLENDEAVLEALRFVYGPAAAWMDLDSIIEHELRDPQKRRSDFKRYWLNQPVTVEESFVTAEQWDALVKPDRQLVARERIVLGFDGSLNNDATALVFATCEHVPHVGVVGEGVWEKDLSSSLDWRPPRLHILELIRQACKQYTVVEIAVDPRFWVSDMEILDEEGLPVVEFRQQDRHMIEATHRFYELVNGGNLSHSGDEHLRRHMLHARVKSDARGSRLSKETKYSPFKIDAAVAAVMAVDRAADFVKAPGRAQVINLNAI